jgi:hypothetical protein
MNTKEKEPTSASIITVERQRKFSMIHTIKNGRCILNGGLPTITKFYCVLFK